MQLIPETAERFNVRKPFDPEQNVRGGLAYLRWLLAYFQGDVRLVAAAYNAGEGTVNKYLGIPPYPETRAYMKAILSGYKQQAHPFDASVTEPSPELPRIARRELEKNPDLFSQGACSKVPFVILAKGTNGHIYMMFGLARSG